MTGNPTGTCFGNYSGGQYLSTEITPKIRRTITTENSFSELVILVVKENGAVSEADGYYCTCASSVGLIVWAGECFDTLDITLSQFG